MYFDSLKALGSAIRHKIRVSRQPKISINVETSRSCNLKCIQCATHADGIDKNAVGRSNPKGLMTLETFNKIIPMLNKAVRINLDNHGEPLLNKNLEDIIHQAKKHAPHLMVSLTSNFTRMTRQRAESLLGTGIESIQVSINGAKASTHESIMRGGSSKGLLENLTAFSEARKRITNQLKIFSACITTMKSNIDELVSLPRLLAQYGVTAIRVNSLLPMNRNLISESLYDKPSLQQYRQKIYHQTIREAKRYNIALHLAAIRPKKEVCKYPMHNFSVAFDGELSPCWTLDIKGGYNYYYQGKPVELPYVSFGNVNNQEISSILDSPEFVSYRDKFKTEKAPSYCRLCPVGQGLICG